VERPRWFAGVGLGFHLISVTLDVSSLTVDGTPLATSGTAQIWSLFLQPSWGYELPLGRAWSVQWELGAQIPFFYGGSLRFLETSGVSTSPTDAGLYMSRYGSLALPYVTLFRFKRQL